MVSRTCQNNPAKKEKERKTEKEMGGQHHWMDRKGVERQPAEGRR